VYGIPQLLPGAGLLAGRVTSLCFGLLAFLLALKVSGHYAGEAGAGLTALLLGTFLFGIHQLVIVKTYALVTFLFMLTFFLLAGAPERAARLSLAVAAAFLAGTARLSAMPFAICTLIYALRRARAPQARWWILGVFLGLTACTAAILATDPESAVWNLLTYHAAVWGSASASERVAAMLLARPLSLIFGAPYALHVFLTIMLGLLLAANPPLRARLRAYLAAAPELAPITIGLLLFGLVHLQGGNWYLEYFVPAAFVGMVLVSVGWVKVQRRLQQGQAIRALLAGVVGLALVVFPARQLAEWETLNRVRVPVSTARQTAEQLAALTGPDERLIVLGALWVSIDSRRDPLPGYTMAQFSYWPFADAGQARRLHLVNLEILQEDIRSGRAGAVVLTGLDWQAIIGSNAGTICSALRGQYALASVTELPGEPLAAVYIYDRPAGGSPGPDEAAADPCSRP
jgi:hypothetical protein